MRPGTGEGGLLGLALSVRVRALTVLVLTLVAPFFSGSSKAETWDRIGSYAALIRRAGTNTLVAKDCPSALLGAFHAPRNALLLCANNIEDDPRQVWVVLAHESAHVMQHCHGGPLLADHQVGNALARIEAQSRTTFQELRLYHQSQRRDEIEARLVQGMPPDEVEALFRSFCAERLNDRKVTQPPAALGSQP
ncbi:hypothetical protein MITS9509_02518 [Synechococcus sp. MIT S9509]|uniref:hypothetical protein n=1 Tax=unclassified Synechococcus TaxID=2626047 RepID=UPI0007BAE0C9|nr:MULTISPECIES: hypothetical protein [unclassified Synechococcus]KZR85178.1 hypothetical protein MITS9504_02382 [Synechococcus sp. MIT S9504]KZR91289.1 hypothetical protein MITS9509_02518 [Synechococcus sp. MIT S9509]